MDEFFFFDNVPTAFPLYESVRDMIFAAFGDVKVTVHKTQISFSNKHGFAFVWLPLRKIKGRPDVYIILTFGLGYKLEHPRIVESVQPYPGRWTHHVIIQDMDEVDDEIKEWVSEAYHFSMMK